MKFACIIAIALSLSLMPDVNATNAPEMVTEQLDVVNKQPPVKVVEQWWRYENETKAGWAYQYINQWGGYNYWCIDPFGTECNKYDWYVIYIIPIEAVIIDESRSAEYGDALMREAASSQEMELPSDLPMPTYEEVTQQE